MHSDMSMKENNWNEADKMYPKVYSKDWVIHIERSNQMIFFFKLDHVFCDETGPLLQINRLSSSKLCVRANLFITFNRD